MSISLIKLSHYKNKGLIFMCALFVAYTPMKDAIAWGNSIINEASITLVDISFGTNFPWQNQQQSGYVKAAKNKQTLLGPQIIYTRFKLSNPSNQSTPFKKIWLTFSHQDGTTEYTTDYNLYDANTRQKLIGNTVQLAANSEIELLASYRFIPSYINSSPESIQISWESKKQLRESSCELLFSELRDNNFGHFCD